MSRPSTTFPHPSSHFTSTSRISATTVSLTRHAAKSPLRTPISSRKRTNVTFSATKRNETPKQTKKIRDEASNATFMANSNSSAAQASQQHQMDLSQLPQTQEEVLALLGNMTASLRNLYLMQSVQQDATQAHQVTQILHLYHQIIQKLVANQELTVKGEKLRQMACAQRRYVREIEEWWVHWERRVRELQQEVTTSNKKNASVARQSLDQTAGGTSAAPKSARKKKSNPKTPRAKGPNSSIFYHKNDQVHTPSHFHHAAASNSPTPHTFVFELDEEEFRAIPKYVRGRISLAQLNSFIALLNKCLEEKYQAIATNWRDKELDEQLESRETEGFYWVSDRKLIETGKWKLGMQGKSLLGCLRFLKKAKIEKSTEQMKIIVLEVSKSHQQA